MNTRTLVFSVSAALGLALLATPIQAEVINQTHWLVKPGDTVYSIARQMYPGDTRQQVRFRRELVKSNPGFFQGSNSVMNVGDKLRLPKFATLNPNKPKANPAKTQIAKKSAVTPDPVDAIGKVVITMGDLRATNRSSTRKLDRHSTVFTGDTLTTGKNTRAQIRLKDGALISLQPDSEFKIAEYSFNGAEDGSEKGVFDLIKGGFRTITGLIGHKNKQNYQVRTTVATIGIRGTHYGLMLCDAGSCATDNLADGLYGGVVDGSVAIDNGTGQELFNNDQYFHVAGTDVTPVETLTPPPVFEGTLVDNGTGSSSSDQLLADSQTTSQMPSELFATTEIITDILPADDNPLQEPNQGMSFAYTNNMTPVEYIAGLTSTATYTCTACGTISDTAGSAGLTQNVKVDMDFLQQSMTTYLVTISATDPNGVNTTTVASANNVGFGTNLSGLAQFNISGTGTAGSTICDAGACGGTASLAFVNPDASGVYTTYTLSGSSNTVTGSATATTAVPPQ